MDGVVEVGRNKVYELQAPVTFPGLAGKPIRGRILADRPNCTGTRRSISRAKCELAGDSEAAFESSNAIAQFQWRRVNKRSEHRKKKNRRYEGT